jgi:hypothetical protein
MTYPLDTTVEFVSHRELELSAWSYSLGQFTRTEVRSRPVESEFLHPLRRNSDDR